MTQSGYFKLATTVVLGMDITDGNILFCHGISKESVDKKIATIDYSNRTVYYFLNNPYTYDCGSPYLNLSPITIGDRLHPYKIARYTPYLFPAAIYVASKKYVSTLNTPYDSPATPYPNF